MKNKYRNMAIKWVLGSPGGKKRAATLTELRRLGKIASRASNKNSNRAVKVLSEELIYLCGIRQYEYKTEKYSIPACMAFCRALLKILEHNKGK